jgi:hypothetical protein
MALANLQLNAKTHKSRQDYSGGFLICDANNG